MIIGPFFMAKHNFLLCFVFFVFPLESQICISVFKPVLVSSSWPKKPF